MKRLLHLLHLSWLMFRLRKAKSEATQQVAKKALAAKLADGRGLPMKIGQVLAGMDDDSSFKALTTSVKPWVLRDITPLLDEAWGKPWQQVLESIEESQAAASLGQVHRVKDKQGHILAIKVQYPDMQQAVTSEMGLAGMMPRAGPVKRWGFDLDAYKATLKENMLYELDYTHEKQQQIAFKEAISVEGLHVPAVVEHLCRPRVLAQSWMQGERLSVAKGWSQLQRLSIAKILMQTMFQSLFKIGLVHGDPHPGNFFFQQDGAKASVSLLDFGCMIHVEEKRRLALLQLMLCARGECQVDALDAFSALGFDATKLRLIQHKLPQLMQILFCPFIQEKCFDLSSWHPGRETEALLAEERWLFRAAGPADLFLLMRVFQGLVQQCITLKAQLAWWPLLLQVVPEHMVSEAKKHALPSAPVVVEVPFVGTATTLHIRICEHGKQKVHLQLPATNALQLSELMPAEAQGVLQTQDISLQALEASLRKHGVDPQSLIDITQQEKRYELWLE